MEGQGIQCEESTAKTVPNGIQQHTPITKTLPNQHQRLSEDYHQQQIGYLNTSQGLLSEPFLKGKGAAPIFGGHYSIGTQHSTNGSHNQ